MDILAGEAFAEAGEAWPVAPFAALQGYARHLQVRRAMDLSAVRGGPEDAEEEEEDEECAHCPGSPTGKQGTDLMAAKRARQAGSRPNRLESRARKKFDQLDADGNGLLEGDELIGLAEWVWSSFRADRDPLTLEQTAEEGVKLLTKLDHNRDGALSFDEFAGWFDKTCREIERYRRALAARNRYKRAASAAAAVEQVEPEVGASETAAIMRAQKKFDQLDADGNGLIEGEELVDLAEWVWRCFHPAGKPLSEDQKLEEGAKLLGRLDENGDGALSFEEFAGWFGSTCTRVERYRRKLAQATDQPASKPKAGAPSLSTEDAAMVRAQDRFNQLDVDGNGLLEGDELIGLAEWVWSGFNPGGEVLTDAQKVEEGSKLLGQLDENGDGALSFSEFAGWFHATCQSIARSHLAAQAPVHGLPAPPVPLPAQPACEAAVTELRQSQEVLDGQVKRIQIQLRREEILRNSTSHCLPVNTAEAVEDITASAEAAEAEFIKWEQVQERKRLLTQANLRKLHEFESESRLATDRTVLEPKLPEPGPTETASAESASWPAAVPPALVSPRGPLFPLGGSPPPSPRERLPRGPLLGAGLLPPPPVRSLSPPPMASPRGLVTGLMPPRIPFR